MNFRIAQRVSFVAALLAATVPVTAAADSCWMHNGSLMRLTAAGQGRTFLYEVPRQGLRSAGVGPGTVLFFGANNGGWYRGTARVFSSACPGAPLDYPVEGPVLDNQTTVVMEGSRPVHSNCRPTGRYTTDRLVFTYSHQC